MKINNLLDIRISALKNFENNKMKIVVICSAKGGVGKSTLAFILASILSNKYRVGVWDVDLTNPSLSLMFKSSKTFIEDYGIVPPEIYKNLYFLSITHFGLDNDNNYLALRGQNISNIILELLTITQWPNIDYLIIDTPPTVTDTLLDLIRFLPSAKYVIISSFSFLSLSSVGRLLNIFKSNNKEVLAIVFNEYDKYMKNDSQYLEFYNRLRKDCQNILFLPYIENIENLYGKIETIQNLEILKDFSKRIEEVL